VPAAVSALGSEFEAWQIVHQSGPTDCQATQAAYIASGIAAHVQPFLADPAVILADADLVISRAGGSTLAELAALRVPPILVPLESALDDHQRRNAQAFAAAGAAAVVDRASEPAALTEQLTILLRHLIADRARRQSIATALAGLARPRAAEQISRIIFQAASDPRFVDCPEPLTCHTSPGSIDAFAA
jgi:UDP-N-acetylglucosamine--N-acetylmuramyl-(pentapeptide) pyrophosphoryl-undecaprenol N-acetylglucosamine transferase